MSTTDRVEIERLIGRRALRDIDQAAIDDDISLRAQLALARGGPFLDFVRGAREADGAVAGWCADALRHHEIDPAELGIEAPPAEPGSPLSTLRGIESTIRSAAAMTANGRWHNARVRLVSLAERYPDADETPEWHVAAALLAAAAGDLEEVTNRLNLAASWEATGRLGSTIAALRERIDDADDVNLTEPSWTRLDVDLFDRQGPTDVLRTSAERRTSRRGSDPTVPAQIAYQLADLNLVRCEATEPTIAALLESEIAAITFLEEGANSGQKNLIGWDPVWRLILLYEKGLAELMPWSVFVERAAASSRGLLAGFAGDPKGRARHSAAAAQGVAHDAIFTAVDRAVAPSPGELSADARMAAELAAAIAERPGFEYGRRFQAAALARLADEEESLAVEAFTADIADCRVRFPAASWPIRLHARMLERQHRWEEAAIAWHDYLLANGSHAQAFSGLARCTSEHEQSRIWGRRALELDHANPVMLSEHIERLSMMRHVADGQPALDLLGVLDPDSPGLVEIAADLAESAGAHERAHALLRADAAAGNGRARNRAFWSALRIGDRSSAEEHAIALRQEYPTSTASSRAHAWLGWVNGDAERMWDAVLDGARLIGLDSLQEMAASALISLTQPDLVQSRTAALAPHVQQEHLVLLRTMANSRLNVSAGELVGLQIAKNPNNADLRLVDAEVRLHSEEDPDLEGAIRSLRILTDLVPTWDLGPIMLANVISARDPEEALRLLEGRDLSVSPVVAWMAAAEALRGLDREGEAVALEARYREAYPSGIVTEAPLLRRLARAQECLRLLEEASAMYPDHLALAAEISFTYQQLGRFHDAASIPIELMIDPGFPHRVGCEACSRTGNWEALARVAKAWLGLWQSSHFWDATAAESMLAVAEAAMGDDSRLDSIAASRPRHPGLLRAVALASLGGFGDPAVATAALRTVAPGEAAELL